MKCYIRCESGSQSRAGIQPLLAKYKFKSFVCTDEVLQRLILGSFLLFHFASHFASSQKHLYEFGLFVDSHFMAQT